MTFPVLECGGGEGDGIMSKFLFAGTLPANNMVMTLKQRNLVSTKNVFVKLQT